MSNSVSKPWILDYLIGVAETYGGDLPLVPSSKPVIRAQLVKASIVISLLCMRSDLDYAYQWLTHHKDEHDDSHLWAVLSDQAHEIPVRFNQEAVRLHKKYVATVS